MTQASNESVFEAVGGHETFTRLVDVFYTTARAPSWPGT